jgi:tartrate dehydrogenase/decarboxylase / D-malate dehydrogenase
VANPIGMVWSGALMLEHLGHAQAGAQVLAAIETLLADPHAPKTRDIGGTAGTTDVGQAIAQLLR